MKKTFLVKVRKDLDSEFEVKAFGPRSIILPIVNRYLGEGNDVIIRRI